ncbi:unnamed protein product [Adineta ricciae]|uniref:Apple domain-containing protein n=1 Tax=Adineta ricciae TaxID=249248 RepID=A0A815T5N5_ADIRI|nr:unnamed protein product [Adineta ricciae]CAF1501118.1 unnamed protein product [Adineta ricciae]
MLIMNGWQFQCVTTTCLPYTTITASNIFQCQASCLAQVQCKAASLQRSTSGCQLFDNTMNQNDPMDANMDIIGMTVISGTRTPPARVRGGYRCRLRPLCPIMSHYAPLCLIMPDYGKTLSQLQHQLQPQPQAQAQARTQPQPQAQAQVQPQPQQQHQH